MNKFLKNFFLFWANKEFTSPLRVFMLCFFAQIILLTYLYDKLPPEIPLYLTRQWGPLRLAAPNNIYILPILSLSIMVANTFIASIIRVGNITLSKILLHFGAISGILFFIAELNLIFLII